MGRLGSGWAVASLVAALVAGCAGAAGPSVAPVTSPPASTGPAPLPSSDAPPWLAPADPMARSEAAGLKPEPRESFGFHSHAHLDVFVNGEPVVVPAGIGIDITDPGVKRFEDERGVSYGGIEQCEHACISPLHTHDATGVLHTEAPGSGDNTLAQFFTEWGVRLDATCVGGFCAPDAPIAVFVNGRRYTDDPAGIALADRREIAIVIGTPPATVPASYDFSNA